MKHDCGFSKENYWFRYRACGFLIHNDKMLFVKSNFGDYYYMIGGGVRLGENSNKCAVISNFFINFSILSKKIKKLVQKKLNSNCKVNLKSVKIR